MITQFKIFESLTNEIWYHGSNLNFDKFKLRKGTYLDSYYTNPIFITSDKNFAKTYAGYNNPIIYHVKLLTNKIFNPGSIPNDYDLYMHYEKGAPKKPGEDYELGKNLRDYIEKNFHLGTKVGFNSEYPSREYNSIISGHFSSLETVWFFTWLKKNNFDGSYVYEADTKNVFIFDPTKIKIVKKEILNESLLLEKIDATAIQNFYLELCKLEKIKPVKIVMGKVGHGGAMLVFNAKTLDPLYIQFDLNRMIDAEFAIYHEFAHQICLLKYKDYTHSAKFKKEFKRLNDKYMYSKLSAMLYK